MVRQPSRPTLGEVAETAEEAGFSSLWVMDHFFQLPPDTGLGGPEEPMLEAYTTLGFLARATDRITLGAMVGGVHFRSPGVVLKAVTTLDVLSGGRAWFGIGAGWYKREAEGLGLGWPQRRERFDRLEELLRIAHHAWSGDRSAFEGPFNTLAEPIIAPMPDLTAASADHDRRRRRASDAPPGRPVRRRVQHPGARSGRKPAKLEVLKRHCEEVGRAYEEIEKTSLVEVDLRPGRQTPADVVAQLRAQADEGIEHVMVNMPDVYELGHLRAFGAEIIPELGALQPVG